MYIKTETWSVQDQRRPATLRCPNCRHQGALEGHANAKDLHVGEGVIVGHRRCPRPDCHQHVFTVMDGRTEAIVTTYPLERLDFDATNLPDRVRESMEEAVACHAAEAYTAAGMMVRKTLELLCDEQEAEGNNLYERLEALRGSVVIPQALMEGLHDLRLLGNDAAHAEIRTFSRVGKEEVELAMDVAKEVLKAVYQYSSLIERLRERKNADQPG